MHSRKIQDIYDSYNIPPWLQDHMYRVALVSERLLKKTIHTDLDSDSIIEAALLHDMGNILKMNWNGTIELPLEEIEKWDKVKEVFRNKYGEDCDEATLQILDELNVNDPVKEIVTAMSRSLLHDDDSMNSKICHYADCHTTPYSIVTYEERINDIAKRYNKDSIYIQKALEHGQKLQKELFGDMPDFELEDRLETQKHWLSVIEIRQK